MVSVTITLSDELKSEFNKFSWVSWSELAKEDLLKQEKRMKSWAKVEKILEKSQLTQEKADKLSDEFNWALAKRYEELLKKRR